MTCGSKTFEYSGIVGVFEFEKKYGLGSELATDVSDRFPVWVGLKTSLGDDD